MKKISRILVTGATGFVGSHMCDYLLKDKNNELFATKRWRSDLKNLSNSLKNKNFHLEECELRDPFSVRQVLNKIEVDIVFHFAAQSFVGTSWGYPSVTINDNVAMQINILECARVLRKIPKIFIACTADGYGKLDLKGKSIDESYPQQPVSPYGVGKVAQELLGFQYFSSYKMPIYFARSFAQEGPRKKETFVISSFAKQIALIEKGEKKPVIQVGNLKAKRDFVDVRDSVKAYWDIVNKGCAATPYNVCSGVSHSVQEVFDELCGLSKKKVKKEINSELLRPSDIPELRGDPGKVTKETGWKAIIPFKTTLIDVLNYWRENA